MEEIETKEIAHEVETAIKNTTEFWQFTIPGLPPSVNSLYATFKGRRIKSREGRAWEKLASIYIRKALIKEMEEDQKIRDYFKSKVHMPLKLEIYLYRMSWHCVSKGKEHQFVKFDVSNRIKAMEDVLMSSTGLDDSQVIEVVAKKVSGLSERTVVRLWLFGPEL